MGLIHSRASKKRAKAEAKLADEQRKDIRKARHAAAKDERVAAAGDNPLLQPTMRGMIRKARERKAARGEQS